MSDERALAAELDRALAGEPAGGEARRLAALLATAAQPARFEVADEELERALSALRPRERRRRSLLPVALAAAAVAVAALVWQWPGSSADVQARAARAVDATFFVVEEVRPARPGSFPPTTVSGYVDGVTGRVHARISGGGGLLAETVVAPNGGVERWVAASNTTTIAPSCHELAAACEDLLDPFALYVRALDDSHVSASRVGATYRLTLSRGRLEQTVVVDATTYLPRRIEWRQDRRLFSTTRLTVLERQHAQVSADAWTLSPHPGARVRQLTADGRPVRVLATRRARVRRGDFWLGPRYEGHAARVDAVELTAGTATRIAYGPLVVWNYTDVIPPAVVQNRVLPAKVFGIPGGGVVHAYFGQSARVVVEASFGDRNAALISTRSDKGDAVRAVQQLKRRGSP